MISSVKNHVLFALLALLLLSASSFSFLQQAPNRLLSGSPIALLALLQGWWCGLLLLPLSMMALSFIPPRRWVLIAVILLAEMLLFGAVALAGVGAAALSSEATPLARTSLGGGFWAVFMLAILIAGDAVSRLTRSSVWRILLNLQLLLPVAILLLSGSLDNLSLLKEYANRHEVFHQALGQHVLILLLTLLPAVTLGIPLGVLCFRSVRWRAPVFSVLNIIQTVPSIALFGLLIAPLAGLVSLLPWLAEFGISGIGLAPAIVALVLYSLLPLVRSVVAGLESVSPSVIESARGMGMNARQRFLQVELPLALPLVISGIRVIAVQTIGLAVVAALIGAGGLGAIVFQGLLSSALDLVLLGVIPVVALAAIVDALFKLIVSLLEIPSR